MQNYEKKKMKLYTQIYRTHTQTHITYTNSDKKQQQINITVVW